jgi:hypothetical protein
MSITTMKEKPKKVSFQFNVREGLTQEFREYVYRKHKGYTKGLFSQELELALTNYMKDQNEE